jgi:hypothetical protein
MRMGRRGASSAFWVLVPLKIRKVQHGTHKFEWYKEIIQSVVLASILLQPLHRAFDNNTRSLRTHEHIQEVNTDHVGCLEVTCPSLMSRSLFATMKTVRELAVTGHVEILFSQRRSVQRPPFDD